MTLVDLTMSERSSPSMLESDVRAILGMDRSDWHPPEDPIGNRPHRGFAGWAVKIMAALAICIIVIPDRAKSPGVIPRPQVLAPAVPVRAMSAPVSDPLPKAMRADAADNPPLRGRPILRAPVAPKPASLPVAPVAHARQRTQPVKPPQPPVRIDAPSVLVPAERRADAVVEAKRTTGLVAAVQQPPRSAEAAKGDPKRKPDDITQRRRDSLDLIRSLRRQ